MATLKEQAWNPPPESLTCVISGYEALRKIPWSWGSPAVPFDHVEAVAIFPSFLLKLLQPVSHELTIRSLE